MAKKSVTKSKPATKQLVKKYQFAGANYSTYQQIANPYYVSQSFYEQSEQDADKAYKEAIALGDFSAAQKIKADADAKKTLTQLEDQQNAEKKQLIAETTAANKQETQFSLSEGLTAGVDLAKTYFKQRAAQKAGELTANTIGQAVSTGSSAAGAGAGASAGGTATNTAANVAGAGSSIGAGLATAGIGLGLNIGGTLLEKSGDDNDPTTFTAKEKDRNLAGSAMKSAGTGVGVGATIGSFVPGIGTVVGGAIGGLVGGGIGLIKGIKENKESKKFADEYQKEQQEERDRIASELAKAENLRKAAMREQGNIIAQASNKSFINSRLQGLNTGFGYNTSTNMNTQPTSSFYGKTGGKLPGGHVVPIGDDAVKFIGRKHSEGGIMLDPRTEVEGGETMDKVMMNGGKPNDYFFSSYLKLGGKSFAKRHEELVKEGASQSAIQDLAKKQEAVANKRGEKDRGPEQIAKYGGIHKYQTGKFKIGKLEGTAENTSEAPQSFSDINKVIPMPKNPTPEEGEAYWNAIQDYCAKFPGTQGCWNGAYIDKIDNPKPGEAKNVFSEKKFKSLPYATQAYIAAEDPGGFGKLEAAGFPAKYERPTGLGPGKTTTFLVDTPEEIEQYSKRSKELNEKMKNFDKNYGPSTWVKSKKRGGVRKYQTGDVREEESFLGSELEVQGDAMGTWGETAVREDLSGVKPTVKGGTSFEDTQKIMDAIEAGAIKEGDYKGQTVAAQNKAAVAAAEQSANAQSNANASNVTVRDQNQANAQAPSAQTSVAPGSKGGTNSAGQNAANTATTVAKNQPAFGIRGGIKAMEQVSNLVGIPKDKSVLSKEDEGGTSMARKDVPKGQHAGKKFYGNVTDMEYAGMVAANPWYDFTNFDPSNKDQVLNFQKEYNKRVKAGEKLKEDGKFGQQTATSRLYKDTPAKPTDANPGGYKTEVVDPSTMGPFDTTTKEELEVANLKKGVNGSLLAGLGQLIPVGYALARPYKTEGNLPRMQYAGNVGAGSVRGAILPRVNMNAERAAAERNTVAVKNAIQNTNAGPGAIAAMMAANTAQGNQMLTIANQEQEANKQLAAEEARLGQQASQFNVQTGLEAGMANVRNKLAVDQANLEAGIQEARLKIDEKRYKREEILGALDTAASRIAGIVKDERSYKAQERLAKAIDNTGSYDRFTIYEQLQKESKRKNSPYYGKTDAELRKIASNTYNEFAGKQGEEADNSKKMGGRRYTSRLGDLNRGRNKRNFNI